MTFRRNAHLALFAICATFCFSAPSKAQSNSDIDAAARSVVRIVVVGSDQDGGDPNIGMGSGVAITPNRIVTNAHVVEQVADGSGFVGIVPSEGRKRFTGKVIAYSTNLDLAVIAIQDGIITPATLYSGAVTDGTAVTAMGYPFAVDRAMATGVEEVIRPQSPLKSLGSVGGMRANERMATVVHTAAIGRGNSGGPLVDSCGRVVGINSFLSVSEGVDATFAFALSIPELKAFLAKAKIEPRITSAPCLTADQAAARNAALERADEEEAAQIARRTEADAANMADAKQRIRDDIAGERENRMALAALLFGTGLIGMIGGIIIFATRTAKQRRSAPWLLAIGGVLALASIFVFLTRPKFDEVDDRYTSTQKKRPSPPTNLMPANNTLAANGSSAPTGRLQCSLDTERSRITISETKDIDLDWAASGCVDQKVQYNENGGVWSRSYVPNSESVVTIQSFDPARSRYAIDRFLLATDTIEKARAIRARYQLSTCSSDPGTRQSVGDMETALRGLLPETPNERLIYTCRAKPKTASE